MPFAPFEHFGSNAKPPLPSKPLTRLSRMDPKDRPLTVIGHKNPDTDAICAALGYAEFLRACGHRNARAACCGPINARTSWVLEQAQIAAPELLMDVRTTVGSACSKSVVSASTQDTFFDAYAKMIREDHRCLPIVDDSGRVEGLLELEDLLRLLVPGLQFSLHASAELAEHEEDLQKKQLEIRSVQSSLELIARTLGAEQLLSFRADELSNFLLMVAASSREKVRASLKMYPLDQLIVVVGNRPDSQLAAAQLKARAIIVTGNAPMDPEAYELAKQHEVSVLISPLDTASTVSLVRCAQPAISASHKDYISLEASEALENVRSKIAKNEQHLYPVIDTRTDTLLGVLTKADLVEPVRKRLVLVDHNEFSQAVDGAQQAEIVEVLDHHRLSGNLVTKEPIRFINEIVGSTSTLVARAFAQENLRPKKGTALCLMAGMISDTLLLTSPTTTDLDRELLPWLAEIAQVDCEQFASDFFAAGSMLKELPVDELLEADRKEYNEAGLKLSISQIEELGLSHLKSRRSELLDGLNHLLRERQLNIAFLLVTDIATHRSVLLSAGDENLDQLIDYPQTSAGDHLLKGVVSRKKQFFPYICNQLRAVLES